MSHSHQPGSCEHGPEKVDVRLESLTNSTPAETSLPARILAKSREVAAQSGHKAVYTVGMDVGSTTVKAVVVDTATDQLVYAADGDGCCYGNYELSLSSDQMQLTATDFL